MPVIKHTTKDLDMLDDILTKYYGDNRGVSIMHIVLNANPGLAALGTVYKAGVDITLPEIPEADVVAINRPWGKVG